MSKQYDEYLKRHIEAVGKAADRILHDGLVELNPTEMMYVSNIYRTHDASKTDEQEYTAYDRYFYAESYDFSTVSNSEDVDKNFNYAWLHHIHLNPHHWQHWVLINDSPESGEMVLEMPKIYAVEMVSDWWSFGISSGNEAEILNWYLKHKSYIKLNPKTRDFVEELLGKMNMCYGWKA